MFDLYLMCSAICSLIMVAPSCETWNPSGLVVICLGMFSNSTWVSMIYSMIYILLHSGCCLCIMSRMLTKYILMSFIAVCASLAVFSFSMMSAAFFPLHVCFVPS